MVKHLTLSNSRYSALEAQLKPKYCIFCIAYTFVISIGLVLFIPLNLELNLVGPVSDKSYLLREQNLSVYIRPGADTFLSDISHRVAVRPDVGVFVCSHSRNRERRRTIRSTWARQLRPRPIFILGLSPNRSENLMAHDEAQLYGDVIVEDFMEDYQNLTLKTMFALKHFLRLTPTAKYFLKIDDDVFLNVFNLEKTLYKYRDCRGVIGSKEPIRYAQRDKENKWHVPFWMYPQETFPHFVNGPAYLMTGNIVGEVFKKALETPLITLEDVFVTGIVAHSALNYSLFHSPGFKDYPFLYLDKSCYYR